MTDLQVSEPFALKIKQANLMSRQFPAVIFRHHYGAEGGGTGGIPLAFLVLRDLNQDHEGTQGRDKEYEY